MQKYYFKLSHLIAKELGYGILVNFNTVVAVAFSFVFAVVLVATPHKKKGGQNVNY